SPPHLLSILHTTLHVLPVTIHQPATPSPSSFFFQYYLHHRDLHSFPTRRSSDLSSSFASACFCGSGKKRSMIRSPTWKMPLKRRSEEHTSELQSLAYLVCRLLLEKKKSTS